MRGFPGRHAAEPNGAVESRAAAVSTDVGSRFICAPGGGPVPALCGIRLAVFSRHPGAERRVLVVSIDVNSYKPQRLKYQMSSYSDTPTDLAEYGRRTGTDVVSGRKWVPLHKFVLRQDSSYVTDPIAGGRASGFDMSSSGGGRRWGR